MSRDDLLQGMVLKSREQSERLQALSNISASVKDIGNDAWEARKLDFTSLPPHNSGKLPPSIES